MSSNPRQPPDDAPSVAGIVHALALRGIRLTLAEEPADGLACRDPNGALTAQDRLLLSSRRAQIIGHLAMHAAARRRPPVPAQPCAPRPGFFQEVWWKIAAANPGGSDVIPLVVPYRSGGAERAQAVARALVARHDALRYAFAPAGGRLEARLNDAAAFAVETEPLAEGDDDASLRAMVRSFACRVIPVSAPWLVQARVLHRPSGSGLLLLLVHHIVADGTSARILCEEAQALLEAPAEAGVELPPATQFTAYAHWERSWFSGEYAAALAAYWSGWMRQVPRLAAPAGGPLSWIPGRRIVHPFVLGPRATARLRAQSAQLGSGTPMYLLLAIASLAIGEWTGQDRFAVLVTADGRAASPTPALLSAVGLIMHTDGVEVAIPGDRSLASLIKRLLVEHQSSRSLHFPPNREHAGLRETDFHHRIGVVMNFLRVGTQDPVLGEAAGNGGIDTGSALRAHVPVATDAGHCASPLHPIYVRLSLGQDAFAGSLEFNDSCVDAAAQRAMVRSFLDRLAGVVDDA